MSSSAIKRKPRHQCEEWQMQAHPDGGRYCAACGERETPVQSGRKDPS